jgi:hypothetical protein
MPPRPSPTADLARMYRERIPTATKSIGRLGPVSVGRGGLSMNPMPALRSVVRFVRNQPGTQVSTPINMGGGTVAMGGQGGASQLVFDPAARAVERAVGDITAIPGVGAPSPSYTAEQIRQQGVVPGVLGAAMDYSMFAPAVGAGVRAGRNAMRSATADAAERLAQSMATREMGTPTSPMMPERPVLQADPFTRVTPEGNVGIVSGAGEEVLRPNPPSTQRPSWMTPEPSPSLSQRDMDLLRYNPLEETATADKLARNYETMARGRNPVTRNVDWSTVDPANDVDLTRVFTNELDAQMASPDAALLWSAQKDAKDSIVDYLVRNGLQSELIQRAPSYVNIRTLPNYISTQDWPSLMRTMPALKDHYVGVLRTYGIGM